MKKSAVLFVLCTTFFLHAKPAPDFNLPDMSGQKHSLSQYKGKVIILDFWAMWCVTCWDLFPILNEIQSSVDTSKVAVVGLSIDKKPTKELLPFTKRANIKYQILHDQKAELPKSFGIKMLPTLFIINAKGDIVKMMTKASPDKKSEILKVVDDLLKKSSGNQTGKSEKERDLKLIK